MLSGSLRHPHLGGAAAHAAIQECKVGSVDASIVVTHHVMRFWFSISCVGDAGRVHQRFRHDPDLVLFFRLLIFQNMGGKLLPKRSGGDSVNSSTDSSVLRSLDTPEVQEQLKKYRERMLMYRCESRACIRAAIPCAGD